MPWIESHTVLIRHRKLLQLAIALSLEPVTAMGHLHALWHSVLEQQEDGNLAEWPDEMIARAACYKGDPHLFVSELQAKKWLNGKIIHDWLDYAGRYLQNKYRTGNPRKLKDIYKIHKTVYRSYKSQTKDGLESAHLPYLPDHTKPKPPESPLSLFDKLRSNPAYQGLDIELEFNKMKAWCEANHHKPTERRFVNWLNGADKVISFQKTGSPRKPDYPTEPTGNNDHRLTDDEVKENLTKLKKVIGGVHETKPL